MDKLVVVLTGGVASGKTIISDEFKRLNCTVIDADVVAREIVAKDSKAWRALWKRFGSAILNKDGDINRRYLRKHVFNDNQALNDLNAITHPLINESIQASVESSPDHLVLVVIPLINKMGAESFFDRILVVDTDELVQHKRLQKRDGVDESLAEKMLNAQTSRQQRLLLADDIISNRGTLQELKDSAKLLWGYYQSLIDSHLSTNT